MYSENKKGKNKILLTAAFWLYMAVVFRITVFRPGFGLAHLLQNGRLNLTLFQNYIPLLRKGDWFRFIYLFVGNIIWFIPFGMYLRYMGKPKRGWQIILAGFLFSFTIESLQYIFGTGYSEVDDLILNTAGVCAGMGIMTGLRRLKKAAAG